MRMFRVAPYIIAAIAARAAMAVCGFALLAGASGANAQQVGGKAPAVKANEIGGIVAGPHGPEAGVWVIAETTELPTKFVKIVVTDDQGRYLVPDLPKANYDVWVRGYGLLDSKPEMAKLGQSVDLKADVAPDAKSAALVYPAAWWASLMKLPDDW